MEKKTLKDRLADLVILRNVPDFETAKGWREWRQRAKAEQPIAYWLNDTAADWIKDGYRTLARPFSNAKAWVRYRVFDRYHVIDTGLKPGYADMDRRMLHGMFNMLVDFVEIEKAWMTVVFSSDDRKKYRYPWFSVGRFRIRSFRCPEAGLDHLRWEMTLDDPKLAPEERCDSQASDAREIMALYDWWKNVRPRRPDAMDASGWSEHCDHRRRIKEANGHDNPLDFLDDDDETPEEKELALAIIRKTHEIEKNYDDEDEQMLMRLVKIRKGLWT